MNRCFNKIVPAFVVLLATLRLPTALADQPRAVSLAEQVRGADRIVQAKLTGGQCRFEHGRIYTYYSLSVVETLKGSASATAVLKVPGGVVGLVAYIVPGAPDFYLKEQAVLFLLDEGEACELDGISSGVYRVRNESGEPTVGPLPESTGPLLAADGHLLPPGRPLSLADFKAQIYHLLGSRATQENLEFRPTVKGGAGAKFKAPAGGPELAAGNVQAGFSRILDRPVDIFWDLSRNYGPVRDGVIEWYFDPDSIAGKSPYGTTPAQVLEAVKWSFDQWNAVATSRIAYKYAGSRTDIPDHKLDLVNVITFADSEYIQGIQKDAIASARPFALARRTYVGPEGLDFDLDGRIDFPNFPQGIWEAGTIIDCDIRWDVGGPGADLDFVTDDTPGALSVQGVFNHELGHFAGLVHSPIRDLSYLFSGVNHTPTMFSIAIPNSPNRTPNPMRSLEFDDMLSISMLYPTPEFESQYGVIEGMVTNGVDGSPVRGNFIAVLSAPSGSPYRNLNDAYNRAKTATGVFTDQHGRFSVPGLPAGNYVVGLQPMDDDPPGTNRNAFNTLVARFGDADFVWDEFFNGAEESAIETDPYAASTVSVSAGAVTGGIRIVTNTFAAGRRSLRRLFGERDFYVAANQLRVPFSPASSSQDLAGRKLPQVFQVPYRVVSATVDFASNTAPPEGVQVVWPQILLAVSDPVNPSRPDLERPLAVIANFAGNGTLLSTDPLPFSYPVTVDRPGALWVVVRSPDNRFNAFHNIDVLGAGQDELQVDESFVSQDGGQTWKSVMSYGISWRMGVVVEGTSGLEPLAEPRLVQGDKPSPGGPIRLHFSHVRSLNGSLDGNSPAISLRHTYSADSYPAASLLQEVTRDPLTGKFSFDLVRIVAPADTARYRVTGFGETGLTDRLEGEIAGLSGPTGGVSGTLTIARLSGFGAAGFDGLWSGRLPGTSQNARLDLVTADGRPSGVLVWPAEVQPKPDTNLVFTSVPGDTLVEILSLPANPAGFSLTAADSSGRTSSPAVLGLGADDFEPNQRIKDARDIFPAWGFPSIRHRLNSIRGTIAATKDEDDVDFFRFQVEAGDSVVIDVDAVSSRPFEPVSSLDAYIELFDSTGAQFKGADGRPVVSDDENGLDPFAAFISPRNATVYLKLVDANVAYGDRGKMTGSNAFYELRVTILPRRGDVVRDRVIRIDDALAALAIARGTARLDVQALFAADMDGNGRVEAADVSAVFRRALEDPFPRAGSTALAGRASPPLAPLTLRLGRTASGGRVLIASGAGPQEVWFMLELAADRSPGPQDLRPAAESVWIESARLDGNLYVIGRYQNPAGESSGEVSLLEVAPEAGEGLRIVSASAGNPGGEIPVVVETLERVSSLPPGEFSLLKNHPNPFNPSTTIGYGVPQSALGGPVQVKLTVFDLRGRTIKVLADKLHEPGSYTVTWDGTDSAGRPLASGVYFYRLTAEGFVSTRKMVLLK